MKLYRTILGFCLFFTFFCFHKAGIIQASSGNIFGLHLTQLSDIDSATGLINSGNGDWGWATIVIRTDQLDFNAWQEFFNKCRKYHIIPIIRFATIMENNYWKKPEIADIDNLTNFVNSLNWPTKQQHIILFNEINHGDEWGGVVDIKSYIDIAIYSSSRLKKLNSNFIILGSALDLAAPEKPDKFKSALNVYREIFIYKPEYFEIIDGLASHSYPNHGYIGTPKNIGQHSILGYQWELNIIKSFNISKKYPVFITETGWPHREGITPANEFYTTETTSRFMLEAISKWSKDEQVKAITPFIYNYPNPPFDHFSWLDFKGNLYPNYQSIISLPKTKNYPEQTTKFEIINNQLPFIIFTNNEYLGHITIRNTGQSIWGETKFCLNPQSTQNIILEAICTNEKYIYPGQQSTFNYKIKILNTENPYEKSFISWDNLPPLEITPINNSGTIYSPKTNLKQKIIQYLQNLFI